MVSSANLQAFLADIPGLGYKRRHSQSFPELPSFRQLEGIVSVDFRSECFACTTVVDF